MPVHSVQQQGILARVIAILWIFFLTWTVYFSTLFIPFFFDDHHIIDNASLHSLAIQWQELLHNWYKFQNSRIFPDLTFALNYYVHGLDVPGYHAVNILIHAINALILMRMFSFLVSIHTSAEEQVSSRSSITFIQYTVISFFIIHPLLTGCVNYTVQRAELMAMTFYALGFLCYLHLRHQTGTRRPVWAFLILICWYLALKSKITTVTFPGMLLGYEVILGASTPEFMKKLMHAGIAVSGLALCFILLQYEFHLFIPQATSVGFNAGELWGPWEQFQAQSRALFYYWRNLFLPYPGWLSVDHDFRISSQFIDPVALLALLGHLLIAAGALLLARQKRIYAALGIFWFYVVQSPYMITPIADILVDYRVYSVSPGFFLIMLEMLKFLNHRVSPHGFRSLLLGLGCLTLLTAWNRNLDYDSNITLWEDALNKAPENARAYNNLGDVYFNESQWGKAENAFQNAIRIKPDYFDARRNLAKVHVFTERYSQGLEIYHSILKETPQDPLSYFGIGYIHKKRNENTEAESAMRKAIEIMEAPDYEGPLYYKSDFAASVYNSLGDLLMGEGRIDEALIYLKKSLHIDPDNAFTLYNLGTAYMKIEVWDQAMSHLIRSIERNPNHADAWNNLGIVFIQVGQRENAKKAFRKGLSIAPRNSQLLQNYSRSMNSPQSGPHHNDQAGFFGK
ncbi:MAG: tetratricopeptide repeat protein [SAR324 cluster bacterium]|nr:tetratricopeptide repeat protein [SAR324 cluster bacterium]